jgi:hypothetical protein
MPHGNNSPMRMPVGSPKPRYQRAQRIEQIDPEQDAHTGLLVSELFKWGYQHQSQRRLRHRNIPVALASLRYFFGALRVRVGSLD